MPWISLLLLLLYYYYFIDDSLDILCYYLNFKPRVLCAPCSCRPSTACKLLGLYDTALKRILRLNQPGSYYLHNFIFLDLDIPKLNVSSQQTIKENSSFAISCASVGSPSATYQWSKSGAIVSNSAVLSFAMVNRVDIGTYSCNATNAFGSKVSSNLNLDVQCK